jgi:molybdate transport system substrate-binding protein
VDRRSFVATLPGLLALPRRVFGGEEVVVFAAASLTDALTEIAAAFERRTGNRVLLSFGGSSTLARQIRAGAPAQVFVSADLAQMDELEKAGLVRAADRIALVSNRLAVVVPAASTLTIRSASDLARARRIALADPEVVPAGVYARQWLEGLGLWAALRDRVVPTLDVRAALAAVASEAADAGVVYRTDAAISTRVRMAFEVPEAAAPAIVYPAALLATPTGQAARAFVASLRSAEARATFVKLGFVVLPEP